MAILTGIVIYWVSIWAVLLLWGLIDLILSRKAYEAVWDNLQFKHKNIDKRITEAKWTPIPNTVWQYELPKHTIHYSYPRHLKFSLIKNFKWKEPQSVIIPFLLFPLFYPLLLGMSFIELKEKRLKFTDFFESWIVSIRIIIKNRDEIKILKEEILARKQAKKRLSKKEIYQFKGEFL